MRLKKIYTLLGFIMTILVIIGDFWVSLNLDSIKYAFFIFLIANISAIVHFHLSRSYYLVLLNIFSLFLNSFAIYNYFDQNLIISFFSLLSSLLFIFIYFLFFKDKKLNNNLNKSIIDEIIFSFLIFVGMIFISLNNEFCSLIGFSIWLFSTSIGIKVAEKIDSKGLYYQILAYIPIELFGIISYSNNFEFFFILYSYFSFIIIYLFFTSGVAVYETKST